MRSFILGSGLIGQNRRRARGRIEEVSIDSTLDLPTPGATRESIGVTLELPTPSATRESIGVTLDLP